MSKSDRQALIAALRKYWTELDGDYGCEHTSSFGEWCRSCDEAAVDAVRAAADALEAAEQERAMTLHAMYDADERDALQAQVAALTAQLAKVREAAEALVKKLRAVHADPRYEAVWVSYHVHGGRYDEPRYDAELNALETALTPPAPSTGETR